MEDRLKYENESDNEENESDDDIDQFCDDESYYEEPYKEGSDLSENDSSENEPFVEQDKLDYNADMEKQILVKYNPPVIIEENPNNLIIDKQQYSYNFCVMI